MKYRRPNPLFHLPWALQDLAARCVQLLVLSLSARTARRVARALGGFAWYFLAKRSGIALREAERVLGRSGHSVARRSFMHLVEMIFQTVWSLRLYTRANWNRHVELHGFEHLRNALAQGRGVIAVSGHFGNWEAFGRLLGLLGHRVHIVRRRMDNPILNDTFERFWLARGTRVIWREGALREGLAVLRRGEILVMYADQDAHRSGVFVPFLGKPASTVRAPALLSIRSGAPIVTFAVADQKDGKCRITFEQGFAAEKGADKDAEVARVTARFTSELEKHILAAPDQWMWIHRRWKTRPEEAAAQESAGEA